MPTKSSASKQHQLLLVTPWGSTPSSVATADTTTLQELLCAIARPSPELQRNPAKYYACINTHRFSFLPADSIDGDMQIFDLGVRPGDTLQVLPRVSGGGDLDPETLWELIAFDLESQVDGLPFALMPGDECDICCADDVKLVFLCHLKYCRTCVMAQMKSNNFKIRCSCGEESGVENLLVSLKSILGCFRETQELLRNVDVQVCRCGTMLFNDTLNPWAICTRCNFQMCFHCKRPWDRATMSTTTPHQCCATCPFAQQFAYELVPFAMSSVPGAQIPNRRLCPSCNVVGGYDSKCKYHRCACGHSFCFYCLKSESECKKTSSYDKVCTLVKQSACTMKHLMANPKGPTA